MTLNFDPNHSFATFPPELIQHIFSYLDDSELEKCRQVCKQWQELGSDEIFLKTRYSEPDEAFGLKKWETLIGKVEQVPHLHSEIKKILESPCPIHEGKNIKDTHILFYNPKQVNGQPHTINNIEKLISRYGTGYGMFWKQGRDEHGDTPNKKGEWILMTRDILPESGNKTYTEQQILIENLSKKAQIEYQAPKLIEAITGIFIEFVNSRTRLYPANSWTTTCCQEPVYDMIGNKIQSAVGNFSGPLDFLLPGLNITGVVVCPYAGIGAVRKF